MERILLCRYSKAFTSNARPAFVSWSIAPVVGPGKWLESGQVRSVDVRTALVRLPVSVT